MAPCPAGIVHTICVCVRPFAVTGHGDPPIEIEPDVPKFAPVTVSKPWPIVPDVDVERLLIVGGL